MISKKKAAKKPTSTKQAKKPVKSTAKRSHKKKSPVTKGSLPMNEIQNPTQSNTVEALLADIAAKLTELVQIESYLANKVLETNKTINVLATPVQQTASALASVPAVATPTQQTAPTVSSRPGAGTVGGLVWDYCDGLTRQLGKTPTKEELLGAIKQYSPTCNGQPVNELTASTQYSKWRTAAGLPRLPRGFGANKSATVPTPTAPTIGAPTPIAQPTPSAAPAQTAMALPLPTPIQQPIPTAAIPSIIAPTAAPATTTVSLPPWLRPQG
jgi:hypothetical protein